MIRCNKCGQKLKGVRKTMLPNKTFVCEKKCKPRKIALSKEELPASDTIAGRQAVTIAKPNNIVRNKQQVLVYDNIAPIVVNGESDSGKLLRKGAKTNKEIIAPSIELAAKKDKVKNKR